MIPNQVLRRLEKIETSMGARDDVPAPNIPIVFVSPDGTESEPQTLEELQAGGGLSRKKQVNDHPEDSAKEAGAARTGLVVENDSSVKPTSRVCAGCANS
jgi:hypothetical protein